MATYVAEYKEELLKLGRVPFLNVHHDSVLIVLGLAGTLGTAAASGTVVTAGSDIMLLGTLVGRVFPLRKGRDAPPGPIVVGRTSDSDVAIPEYSISKQHCYIAVVNNQPRLIDCGSTNGTLVNGTPLVAKKPYPLVGGESITLGRFALLFHRPQGFVAYLDSLP
jgi:pSer/pThr/pTyr-binding forkhead associated (FHA) protein